MKYFMLTVIVLLTMPFLNASVILLGEINADKLNIREAPSLKAERIGSYAYKSKIIAGDTTEKGWLKVFLDDGRSGYVSARYVTIKKIYTPEEFERIVKQSGK